MMVYSSVIGRVLLFCFVIFLPGVGNSAEKLIDGGSSTFGWELFDARPLGARIRIERDPVFNSDSLFFSGTGIQNAFKKDLVIESPIVKFEMRTEEPDQDFEIVFFANTTDGQRRIAKYTTIESGKTEPSKVVKILPVHVKDSNAYVLTFNLKDDLLAGGFDFEEVYQLRIRGNGVIINKISGLDAKRNAVLQPLLTFEQVTGDDVVDSVEDDAPVVVAGYTSEIESGQTLFLQTESDSYTTTIQNNRFSVNVPADDVRQWSERTTLTARAKNIGGLEVVTEHEVTRIIGPPADNGFYSNGMVNLSDRLEVDQRGLKAFPGAEGGGQNSNGGRGGALYTVNTRDCSVRSGDGKISVREALEAVGDVQPGNRTVVFSVGGLFDCGKTAYLRVKGELTLACQTAPYPGVNIAAYRIEYKRVKNIIVRGCQFFNHDYKNGDSGSVLRVVTSGDSNDLIFDRLNFLHNSDDLSLAFIHPSTAGNIRRVTLSNSIIAESDAYSNHPESMPRSGNPRRYVHAHGASCSTNATGQRITECSVIGNLFAHTARRNPKFTGASGEVIGNFFYNNQETGPYLIQQNASNVDLYVIDNVFKYGPNTKPNITTDGILLRLNSNSRIKMIRNKRSLLDGSVLAYPNLNSNPRRPLLTRNTTFNIDCDGAKYRDPNILRILDEVRNGTGEVGIGTYGNPLRNDGDAGRHYINNPNYYEKTQWPPSYDSDADGMADVWEMEHGLTVGVRDHNGDVDKDGYTNVEEFINAKIRCEI